MATPPTPPDDDGDGDGDGGPALSPAIKRIRHEKVTLARRKRLEERRRMVTLTANDLRDEGVFEVGRVVDSSVLYVVTEERVFLVHAENVINRRASRPSKQATRTTRPAPRAQLALQALA